MTIPIITRQGCVHLDLRESVSDESRARQFAAAGAYMVALTAQRAAGSTFNEATEVARREFDKTWRGQQS
jgi:hypothetical protein